MTNYELAKQFKAMGIKSGTIELEGNKSVTIEGNKFSFTEVIDLDSTPDAKPARVLEPTKVEPMEEPPEEDIEDPEPVSDSDAESSIPDDFFGDNSGEEEDEDNAEPPASERASSNRLLVSVPDRKTFINEVAQAYCQAMQSGDPVGKIGWSTLKVPWANTLCYVQVQASKYNPEVTLDDIKDVISDITPVEIDFKDRPHLVTDRQIGLIMCMSEPAARVYVRKYNIQEQSERVPHTARINYYFDIRQFYAKIAEDKSAPCLIYHAMRVRRAMERRSVKPLN